MKTSSKILLLLIVSATFLISCGKKEDKFPLTGRWVVVDAIITDDYFTREMVLGNCYIFNQTTMVYKNAAFAGDSSVYELTYLDKNTVQTYNKDYGTKSIYTYQFEKGDGKKRLKFQTGGFTYFMEKN